MTLFCQYRLLLRSLAWRILSGLLQEEDASTTKMSMTAQSSLVDMDVDSEEERLLNSIDLTNFRQPAERSKPWENMSVRCGSSPELSSLPPSPKRPLTQLNTDTELTRPQVSAPEAKKATKASAKEQRKALVEARLVEKDLARQQKAADKQAKKAEKIRQAFADAEDRGTFRRNEIEVVVSPQLFSDTTRNDVLSHVRAFFPDQIFEAEFGLQNLVTWRRKDVKASSSQSPCKKNDMEADVSLIIFSGAEYWDMMVNKSPSNSLLGCAQEILSKRKGGQVFYVIYGIESECNRRRNNAVRPGAKEPVITMQAVQDSYTALYMDYGIRTHAFSKVEDAAKYIVELTDAYADRPYHQQDDFLDATLAYRDARKKLSNRSTIVSMEEVYGSQENAMVDDEVNDEDLGGKRQGGNAVADNGLLFVPFVRSEGRHDLGYMYLAILALIPRMSYEKAMAIRKRYPTLCHLERAYRRCSSLEEQHSILADVRCEPNNRRLGPALSKLIATVFTSQNPSTAFRM